MARIFDVIECPDMGLNEIVRRFPESGSGDFRIGSQLIVREGQSAVFFRDGKALDSFGPGRHTITTANIPLLVNLVRKVFSGNTPFTAEVYFVNQRDMLDQRWGTSDPITLPDRVLRMVRIRARGTYSMQVSDPQMFVSQVVGARGHYDAKDISDFLRSMIVSQLTDMLGENMTSILNLPSLFEEISAGVRVKLRDSFSALGFALKRFLVESISPTDETSKAIDEAASMGAIGDMDSYMKFKSARAIGDVATAPGGAGGPAQLGMQMAMGMAAGKAMADSFGAPSQPQAAPAAATAAAAGATAATVACPKCQQPNPAGSKFCNSCGAAMGAPKCPACGTQNPMGAKFCSNCGGKLG